MKIRINSLYLLIFSFLFAFLPAAVWLIFPFWVFIIVYPLTVFFVLVLVSYEKDVSIPYLDRSLKREYFRAKFRLDAAAGLHLGRRKKRFIFILKGVKFFYKFYIKFLYFLVLIFKSAEDSFIIVSEEAPMLYEKGLGRKSKNKTLDLFLEHKKVQKKASIFSLSGLAIIILATLVVSWTLDFAVPSLRLAFGATQTAVWTNNSDFTNNQNTTQSATTFNNTEVGEANLVSVWHMDNNWNDSAGINNGTVSGNVTFSTSSRVGAYAGSFGGAVGDYVSIANGYTNTIKGDETHAVEMWIYPNSLANGPVLISANGLGAWGYFIQIDASVVYWSVGGNYKTFNIPLSVGQWSHLAFVKTVGGGDLYVNGSLVTSYSGSLGNIPNQDSDLFLSHYNYTGLEFNGRIDELAIYNDVLSAEAVARHYNSGVGKQIYGPGSVRLSVATSSISHTLTADFAGENSSTTVLSNSVRLNTYQTKVANTASLVSYWKMDNNWTDSAGVNNGTAQGGTTFGTAKHGSYAGVFNGIGDYVDAGDDASLNITGTSVSIEAWVKSPVRQDWWTIAGKMSSNWDAGYSLYFGYGNQVIFGVNYMGGGNEAVASFIYDGNWHHIVGTYDGSFIRIFVDGVEGAPFAYTEGITITSNHFMIGRAITSIDEVAVYNSALSAETIADHYGSSSLSGAYTSQAVDLGVKASFSTFNFSQTASASGTIQFQLAANNDNSTWNFTGPDGTAGTYYTATSTTVHSSLNNNRYVKYKAYLSTSDSNYTPILNDVTLNYYGYPAYGTLSGLMIDAASDKPFGSIAWNGTAPSGTAMKFRTRGLTNSQYSGSCASSMVSVNPAWSAYYTAGGNIVDDGNNVFPSFRCLEIEYRGESDGLATPVLDDFTIVYGNKPPLVQSVSASQSADGTVTVNYEAKDEDTLSGVTPGAVNIILEYCTADCSSPSPTWAQASAVTGGAGAGVSVTENTWSAHSLVWQANSDYPAQYVADLKVRIKANDSETVSNIGYGVSGSFVLDTKNPVPGSPAIYINASASPATIYLSATDDSVLEMRVGLNNPPTDGSWSAIASSTTVSLATNPDTVYVQFRDAYNNISSASAATPETPINMVIRDISNPATNDYQAFIAWKAIAVPDPGFDRYEIWRSTNGTDYSLVSSSTSRATNYYFNSGLTANITYYYKVLAKDQNGNTSPFSSVVSDKADGQGGTDTTPPTVSGVQISNITTQSARIIWNTDELSNSSVGYAANVKTYATESGIASMVNNVSGNGPHEITLTNLSPGTIYYFRAVSADPEGNSTTDTNGGEGYTFTTASGPAISAVSVLEASNNSATISWNTTLPSDSYVVYSSRSDLASSSSAGANESVTEHLVTLSGLTSGTKYYYYVTSGVAQDKNGGSYYNFTTTIDLTGPVISAVSAASVTDVMAVIQWTTNERATSRVEYGLAPGSYTANSSNNSLDIDHSIVLSGLSARTTYYYRVVSADPSGNSTSGAEYTFTTRETLSEESQVQARERAVRETIGGGILIIKEGKADTSAPVIANVIPSNIQSDKATITWTTDELSSSFVEYGLTVGYGRTVGRFESATSHAVTLDNLFPEKIYNFRVVSTDQAGNLGSSQNNIFTTVSYAEDFDREKKETASDTEAPVTDETFISTIGKAMEVIKAMASRVSLTALESGLSAQYNSLQEMARIIPSPDLNFGPNVETTASTAKISWTTDKIANSLVALAREDAYLIAVSANQADPYSQVIGNFEEMTTDHVVEITDLEPDTLYHYQVRHKTPFGPLGASLDFTFRTKTESLEITNYSVEKVSGETAVFRWVTNIESNSKVTYMPYRGNNLAVDEARSSSKEAYTTIHQVEINDFESGVVYEVQLSSADVNGNVANRSIPAFTTSEDDLAPVISQVQTDSAISPGKQVKTQTIISWVTNEPSTSRVYYEKGFSGGDELKQSTKLDGNYTKKHIVVLTSFDPGSVYRFRVESIDSGGNAAVSRTFTILTPRQEESVFQIILKNFEQVFGWMGKLGI